LNFHLLLLLLLHHHLRLLPLLVLTNINLQSTSSLSRQFQDDYQIGATLGAGTYGTVKLGRNKHTCALHAVKCIAKPVLTDHRAIDDLRREVQILNLLSPHHTIAGYIDSYEDASHVYIVLELCQGGELFDKITTMKRFSEADASIYFKKMAELVHHCHSCGVMHRDLKPENFLLTDTTDKAELKACDFGLATYFKPNQRFNSLTGSAYYISPETIRRSYTNSCDIWSLGVILYILLSGRPPFYGKTEKDIFTSILAGAIPFSAEPWPSVSDAAKDLIQKMLTLDPAERISVEAILTHPWLQQQGVAPSRPLGTLVLDRLRNFSGMTRLKRAYIIAAATHLNIESIYGLLELFRRFDLNGDGTISLEEFKAVITANNNKKGGSVNDGDGDCDGRTDTTTRPATTTPGITPHAPPALTTTTTATSLIAQQLEEALLAVSEEEDIERLWNRVDVDATGAVNYKEWIAATVNMNLIEREDILARLFTEMDTDRSGGLTAEEIRSHMARLGNVFTLEEIEEAIQAGDTNGDGVIDFDEFLAAWKNDDVGGVVQRAASMANGDVRYRNDDMDILKDVDV
jgi:calcium-dependent protein kinase